MTLHRLPSAGGLLARKGGASPLGLRKTASDDLNADSPVDPGEGEAKAREPVQLALVAGAETEFPGEIAGEPPPPASLLPFTLHRAQPDDGDAWELVSPDLLARLNGAVKPAEIPEAPRTPPPAEPTAGAESASKLLFPDKSGTLRIQPSRLTIRIPDPVPVRAPDSPREPAAPTGDSADKLSAPDALVARQPSEVAGATAAESDRTPVAEPSWRVGVDNFQVAQRAGPGRWLAWAAAACLLIGAIAWWSFQSQAPDPREESAAAESRAADAALEGPAAGDTQIVPAAPSQTKPDAAAAGSATSQAPRAAAGAAGADPMAPSVDLVRIETNGDAVIAGRAAPYSELIILDNAKPIGSVKADAFGEWVFVPEVPLAQGGHEFGLVLKSVQGKVSVPADAPTSGQAPAAGAPEGRDGAEPRLEQDGLLAPVPPRKPFGLPGKSELDAPIPERKPYLGDAGTSDPAALDSASADFAVQLASVKTHDGARREWQKLQSRFPEVLSDMDLKLHETKLSQQGTVIRVRTGPFQARSEAVDFCARFRAVRQDCLVVRTSAGNYAKGP